MMASAAACGMAIAAAAGGIHGLGVGIPWQRAESDPAWYATATAALRPAWFYTWRADQIGAPGYVAMNAAMAAL